MDNDKEEFGGIQKSDVLALLKYLFELTDYLPPKQKEEFLHSMVRLEMKHLIDMLEHWELDSLS
ncbi:MAG: hypothetical protein LBC46_03020 [Treponema sp.]|jgi:uncharacterized protein (UPF0305 family)|nr:hypothetical protein [Treponema sp.]